MTPAADSELRAAGWTWPTIRHGFGARDAAVAAGFHLVRARQVHGADVLAVSERSPSPAGDADALVTDRPGVAAAIATADCVPLLVAAPDARVVAAVHAGWRGTLGGVGLAALAVLRERYGVAADDVLVALGPAIGGCCFEIEREIAARFADRFGDAVWKAWQDGRPGKGLLDLRRVNQISLEQAGVAAAAIQHVGPCTSCGGGPYASYRAQGPGSARQLSWIGIVDGEASIPDRRSHE
jgi:YfiH family protein